MSGARPSPDARRLAERLHTATAQTRAGRLRLRPHRAEDAPALHALVLASLAEGAWFLRDPDEAAPDPPALLERLDRVLAGHGFVVVGTLGARPVALATVTRQRFRRTAHVGGVEIRVDASVRGQGVGRAVLHRVIERCEADPTLDRLCLTVLADNAPAVSLYRSTGFVEEGRLVGEVREAGGALRDVLLMARPVPWGPLSGGSPS